MKVNSINSYTPQYLNSAYRNKKQENNKNIQNNDNQNFIKEGLPVSVSFTGTGVGLDERKKFKAMKSNFTPEAEKIYKKGQKLAALSGSNRLETKHLYLASLLSVRDYIKELDDGVIQYNEDTNRERLPVSIEEMAYDGCRALDNEKSRAKIAKVINKHIVKTQKMITPQGKRQKSFLPVIGAPQPAKETIDDMYEAYDMAVSSVDAAGFYDNYFIMSSLYSSDKTLAKEAVSLSTDIQKALMIDDAKTKKKNHLQFYDDKADNIWKNISHGNDVIYLYNTNDQSSADHLVSSFVNLINKPGQSYKNLDPDKIDIIVLNKFATFDLVDKLAKEIKINKANQGKTTVIAGNLLNLIQNAGGQVSLDSLRTLKNEENKTGGTLRFVFGFNPESYYANTAKGASFAPILSNYAVQTIPSLNAKDAIEQLTDKNGLRYIAGETKNAYSKETVKKAIELTSTEDGNYPDKVLTVLSGASKYFVDEDEITPAKLEKYITETRKLSEAGQSEQSNIIYITDKTTADIIGSPMTKKDAQTIVKQIKDGTIGTKGFIAQLEDGSSYGGGRRHTAEAIAGEAKIPMVVINAKDFALKDIDALSQNANLSEMKIKTIVSTAKAQAEANEHKTAMIFIENFDNFASNPLYGISSIYEQKAFSQLLDEMDKTRKNDNVNLIVVGSANMPEIIDPNIMKPYKFLNSIIIYPPQDSNQREEVLRYYIDKMGLKIEGETKEDKDKVIRNIAETTQGFTVSDLMYLLDVSKSVISTRNKTEINISDFTEAYLQATTGSVNERETSLANKRVVTSHEAGHAVTLQVMYDMAEKSNIPWHLPDKVNFITLDPRGSYAGAMYHKDSGNDEFSYEKLMSDLVCSFGGHSAEKIIYNMAGSWGITGDMEHISALARAAVLDMGMGPRTGVTHIKRNALGAPDVSNKKMEKIEEDIDAFVNSACKISDLIVTEYKDFILEFTDKYAAKVGTGDCLVSSEEFKNEFDNWREKQPKEKQEKLAALECKIQHIMAKAKEAPKEKSIS